MDKREFLGWKGYVARRDDREVGAGGSVHEIMDRENGARGHGSRGGGKVRGLANGEAEVWGNGDAGRRQGRGNGGCRGRGDEAEGECRGERRGESLIGSGRRNELSSKGRLKEIGSLESESFLDVGEGLKEQGRESMSVSKV
jgi:hypothetical protein